MQQTTAEDSSDDPGISDDGDSSDSSYEIEDIHLPSAGASIEVYKKVRNNTLLFQSFLRTHKSY